MQLVGRALAGGYRVSVFDEIGSTNDVALQAAQAGDPDRHWFVAHRQTSGRGRAGRAWYSPTGNLHASLLIQHRGRPDTLSQYGFVIGVAAHRAFAAMIGESARFLTLKWPNDLLFRGAKIGGMLLESRSLADGSIAVAAGIGVNLVAHPADAPYPATNFSAEGFALRFEEAFAGLSDEIAGTLAVWQNGVGFADILAEWRRRAHGLGDAVSVQRSSGRIEGLFDTVDEAGRLILLTASGRLVIEAADVFFPAGETGREGARG